jgi:hypothetical protein
VRRAPKVAEVVRGERDSRGAVEGNDRRGRAGISAMKRGVLEGVHLGYEEEGVEELGDNRSATVRNLPDPEVPR